jgi:hypothetical protein
VLPKTVTRQRILRQLEGRPGSATTLRGWPIPLRSKEPTLQVIVKCACGRKMTPHPYRTANFRCGCGGGADVAVLASPAPKRQGCVGADCTRAVVDRKVVPLCSKHLEMLTLALAPLVYTRFSPTKWLRFSDEYEKAFGEQPEKAEWVERVVYDSNEPQAFPRISAASARNKHDAVVYFIIVGDQVKIGTTTNMTQRFQSMVPPGAKVYVIPGSYGVEARYHERFDQDRIDGTEWFELSPRLRTHIDSLVASGEAITPDRVRPLYYMP